MSTDSIISAFQITSTNIRIKPYPINLETKTIKFKTIADIPNTTAKRYINSSEGVLLLYFILFKKICSQGRIRTFTGCHYSNHIETMLFYPRCYNHALRLPG
jgi:hypothetical protein